MTRYVRPLFVLLLTSLFVLGCGLDNEDPTISENDGSVDEKSNNNETDNHSNKSKSILSVVHSFEEKEDIDVENISINYDGSIIFFNEVDDSGEDEEITPYFIHNGDLIEASSVGNYSDCRFYSMDEKNTSYVSGICDDENDDRVAVVYDVENNTITHSTDRDKILTVLADGRVLFTVQYSGDGTIYELTENGEEPFLVMGDMTDVLGISSDEKGEIFFIYGANNDYWNAYIYDTENDSEPVLFDEIPDDAEAKTVEGEISPDEKYIMYRHRGVSGGEHYNYVDSYILDRDTEEEIHLGHGFDLNFVRPNGYVFDEVREYGRVIYNTDSARWLAPEEKDFSFIDSIYANEYIDAEEKSAISTSNFQGISGDGEAILILDKFRGTDDEKDYFKLHTMKTEDYVHSLEDQDVEIDFEPSPFNEKKHNK